MLSLKFLKQDNRIWIHFISKWGNLKRHGEWSVLDWLIKQIAYCTFGNVAYMRARTHTHTHTYIYIYIYIYREREREINPHHWMDHLSFAPKTLIPNRDKTTEEMYVAFLNSFYTKFKAFNRYLEPIQERTGWYKVSIQFNQICLKEKLLLLSLFTLLEFFTSVLADGFSQEFEWQQVSSSLQDSSQYSDRSQ